MTWLLDYVGALPAQRQRQERKQAPAADLQAAVDAYNRDHSRDWGRTGGTCPVCGHHGCFGNAGGKLRGSGRWACFSASHGSVGVRLGPCWHGDALDVDAQAAGRTRLEHLRAEGYQHPREEAHQRPHNRVTQAGPAVGTTGANMGQPVPPRLTRADVAAVLGRDPDDNEREFLEERAAIRCFDGGQTLEAAEHGALHDLLRHLRYNRGRL